MSLIKRIDLAQKISIRKKNRSIKRAHDTHRKQHSDEYASIDGIIEKFRSGGGLKHQYQSYKLWELSKYLEFFKPKNILELGSGTSTFVFAKYTRSNGTRLTSCDESEHWIENTKNLLGENLHSNISILCAKRKFGFDHEITTVNYDINFEGAFDFIMVDGPSQRINNIRRKDSVNADVLDLSNPPKVILVDGRESTFNYLSEKLQHSYDCFPSDLHSGHNFEPGYNYFSKLVLR